MLKALQKDGDITDDDLHRGQERVQELTKDYTERLDKVLHTKEAEIMEV
jgi:ribosome recycling factor